MNIAGIIQARTGSTRLPGKVVKKIGNKTVLEILLCRVKNLKFFNKLIVATTTKREDDIIETISLQNAVQIFRGSEENVLDRYYQAAKEYNADIIVRITADNPLVSLDLIAFQVDHLIKHDCDYVSSKGIIIGTGSEVFNFRSLKRSWELGKEKYHIEHVTPYIYENKESFKVKYVSPIKALEREDIRLTIDTKEDFRLYLKLNEAFGDLSYTDIIEIIDYLDEHPDIKEINQNVKQKNYRDC